ncbi:MAG TPA: FecR domain-containing protein [Pedobacter sp.]|uniref:FecR family protein n=1 Tax=Pedobacter sp. TaxID=1411316 RepID=UPI002CC4BE43|nr:FecR domain-containing protein [Pedobacter sp.]HMI03487.1 FecR domain-containing protein [Pedobacter sp.]
MDNAKKNDLIKRYISRQLSPDELDEFFLLMKQGGADFMPEVEDLPDFNYADPDMDIPERILRKDERSKTRYLTIRNAAAIAATVLLIFGGTKAYQFYSWRKLTQTFSTISVPKGMMKTIRLSDSTEVTLTSGSVFRYPMAFDRSSRRVRLLEGNAFFHVKRDVAKPFTVESGTLQTTALGTSFTVQRFSRYGYEKVNLYTGKVRVNNTANRQDSVILYPGEEVKYEPSKGRAAVAHFNTAADPVKGGVMVFEKIPFNEALYHISSYYGVTFRFNKEAFRNKLLTGEYNFHHVEDVLHSLAFVYHLKINKIDHQNYSIMQKK